MTKKDYVKAAHLVQNWNVKVLSRTVAHSLSCKKAGLGELKAMQRVSVELENSFVEFFRNDNPNFDEQLFREACKVK